MNLLQFLYDNRAVLPLKSLHLFQAYCEIEEYTGSQGSFTELMSKLHEKNLVEKPDYGVYDIDERGINKVETLRGLENQGIARPEGYGDIVEELTFYFMEKLDDEIAECRVKGEELSVSLEDLDSYNAEIVEFFEENPDQFMDALREALEDYTVDEVPEYKVLPDLEWLEMALADAKNSSAIGEPIIVEGIIRKSEDVMPLIVSAHFECVQCGDLYEKEQDSSKLKSPYKCDCGSKKFDVEEKLCTDVLDFELSQRDQKETKMDARLLGSIGRDTQMDLMTGSKVKILAKIEEASNGDTKSSKMPTRLQVISYEKSDKKQEISDIEDDKKQHVLEVVDNAEDPLDDVIVPSVAPGLGDMDLPKKVTSISYWGSPEIDEEGTGSKDYGRLHTAIIANPGLGKSGLLNWWQSNFSKTFQAQGKSATSTGLTASVEQTKGGEWRLVAGKLVFADQGVLEIDEFDKFPEGELTSLNTAMEKGFFEVDKATVNGAELPGRATIIAAGNFQGKLDDHTFPYELLPEKGEGLYDRFALMCAITESGSEAHESIKERFMDSDSSSDGPVLDVDELRLYRYMSKQCEPRLCDESWKVLKSFVDAASNKKNSDLQGESNRFVEQLIKITLAVARMNLRDDVALEEDAQKACELVRKSRESMGLSMGDSTVATEYKESKKEEKVLDAYEELSDGETDAVEIEALKEKVTDETQIGGKAFEQVLDNLKNNGEFYKPSQGEVQAV